MSVSHSRREEEEHEEKRRRGWWFVGSWQPYIWWTKQNLGFGTLRSTKSFVPSLHELRLRQFPNLQQGNRVGKAARGLAARSKQMITDALKTLTAVENERTQAAMDGMEQHMVVRPIDKKEHPNAHVIEGADVSRERGAQSFSLTPQRSPPKEKKRPFLDEEDLEAFWQFSSSLSLGGAMRLARCFSSQWPLGGKCDTSF